ncbi:ABC transporter permease [Aureimonas fodinaquatilis]|uniref:ABC transporter permease n=1 Tax=Aureimonas fodinaquatilis TaxID=2565783 RepID=A0A5B0DVL7_9HYPH|nr:ABC transporter permease [Aureimonas fodinaquatilis]KAA0970877.1 ABC transporter permease [Aureimonas fodinaquatilis]
MRSASADRYLRTAIIVGLFAAWEIASRTGLVDPRLLPPASTVFVAAANLLSTPVFWGHLGTTLAQTMVAFIIAVPVGAILGLIIAENRYVSEVLKPLVFFVFSIPKSIFLPMFILAFGIGFGQKVAFGVFSAIFIMMMTAFAAVDSVKREHLLVARAMGAKLPQVVRRVYLPSMAPVLLEAVRLAMIFNFTGILLAEMYASRKGIGNQIGLWGQSFMIDRLLAGILIVSVLAIVFNECVRAVETHVGHWRT